MKIKIKCPKRNKVAIGVVDVDTYNAYEKEDFVCLDTESHSIGLKIDLDKLLIFPNFYVEDEKTPIIQNL